MPVPSDYDRTKIRPLEVVVQGTSREDFEHAFRKFKMLFQRERIVGQLKEKMSYEKPSEKKRRKRREAENRKLLGEMRDRMMKTGEWDRRQKHMAQKRIRSEEKSSEVRDD